MRRKVPRATAADVGYLLSLSEVAERLAVCRRTLERMINRGELHVVRLGHGRGVLRVPVAELRRLIESGNLPV